MENDKIIIVDKDDNPIGLKCRDQIDPAVDIYRVSSIWITNTRGDILIAQRKFTKKNSPGKWGPAVAGTVEEGETYEENAYKEVREEIGIDNIILKKAKKIFLGGNRKKFSQWYTGVIDRNVDEFEIQEEEVEAVKWITPEDLIKDSQQNPDKYLASMPLMIEMFLT